MDERKALSHRCSRLHNHILLFARIVASLQKTIFNFALSLFPCNRAHDHIYANRNQAQNKENIYRALTVKNLAATIHVLVFLFSREEILAHHKLAGDVDHMKHPLIKERKQLLCVYFTHLGLNFFAFV